MTENIRESRAHGEEHKNTHGRAVGAEPKKWNIDIVTPPPATEGVVGTEASAQALCAPVAHVEPGATSGVPLWSVWARTGSLVEIVTRIDADGRIHVVNQCGRTGSYDSGESLRYWREREETEGELEARAIPPDTHAAAACAQRDHAFVSLRKERAAAEALRANNAELGRELQFAQAEAANLRGVLSEEGRVSVAAKPWMVGGGWSAHWRMGTSLTVGPRRATEAEALWDCSVASGELARGKNPTASEVEALVVGLAAMGDNWRDAVCPRAEGAARGHVSSESVKTDDAPSVSDRDGEIYFAEPFAVQGALSDARELHAVDSWAELAGDVPGLTMVLPLAAWFAVALEGEAASRALDTEVERVAVGLVLARAWLLRQDACEVREVIGKATAAAGLTMGDIAIVVARARGLSGVGCES